MSALPRCNYDRNSSSSTMEKFFKTMFRCPGMFVKNSCILREYFPSGGAGRTDASRPIDKSCGKGFYATLNCPGDRQKQKQKQNTDRLGTFPSRTRWGKNSPNARGFIRFLRVGIAPGLAACSHYGLAPVMTPGNIAEHNVSTISLDLPYCDRPDR